MNFQRARKESFIANEHMSLLTKLSLLVMMTVILVPNRYLYFLRGLPRLKFAIPLLVSFVLGVCIVMVRKRTDWLKVKRVFVRCWPVVLLTIVDLAFLIWAYCTSSNPLITYNPPDRWWANYAMVILATPAAFILGVLNRSMGNKRLGVFLLSVLSIGFVIGLMEYLHLSGYENPIGTFLKHLNYHTDELYWVWIWRPGESVRAQGLETEPMFYAFPALIGFIWALSSRKLYAIRATVALLALGMIAISGSRTLLVALVCVIFCVCLYRVYINKNSNRSIADLIVMLVASGVVIALLVLMAMTPAGSWGIFSRLASSVQAISNMGVNQSSNTEVISNLTSGRTDLWADVIALINEHPLGTGQPVTALMHRAYAHNDLLNRYVWGGPLMLLVYLAAIGWLIIYTRTPAAPAFGILLATVILVAGLFDGIVTQNPLLPLPFFILGVLSSPSWLLDEESPQPHP